MSLNRISNTENSKIIILTGATGYLGNRLSKLLIEMGFELICPYRPNSSNRLFDQYKVNWIPYSNNTEDYLSNSINKVSKDIYGIIHAATAYGRKNETKEEISSTNIEYPSILLNIASLLNISWFLNIDTCLPASVNFYAETKSIFKEKFYSDKFKGLKINVPLQQF